MHYLIAIWGKMDEIFVKQQTNKLFLKKNVNFFYKK